MLATGLFLVHKYLFYFIFANQCFLGHHKKVWSNVIVIFENKYKYKKLFLNVYQDINTGWYEIKSSIKPFGKTHKTRFSTLFNVHKFLRDWNSEKLIYILICFRIRFENVLNRPCAYAITYFTINQNVLVHSNNCLLLYCSLKIIYIQNNFL